MKILIVGDFCPRGRVSKLIEKDKGVELFAPDVLQKIKESNYAIVNFECAVADANSKPISKCGPNLRCSAKAVKVLKEAGFHCATLANNHFRDFGDEGVAMSIKAFNENGLEYCGGGLNIEEAEKVFYKRLDDGILAVINVCENEFSIATSTRAGSAPLETVRVFHKIKEARQKSDYVLVIIHGGHEHYQLPSPRMKELYRFLIEVGADAVVNHHQHCYSGYEFFNGKPIVYGLGNFLFDHPKQRKSIWNEGYMAILEFSQSSVKLEQIPYIQCDDEANVRLMNEMEHKRFDDNIEQFNVIISDKNKLEQEMRVFVESRKRSVLGVFTPYMNEYVRAAASRHWLPYCLPKSKVLAMINYISCEAQRDVTLDFLQDYTGINS